MTLLDRHFISRPLLGQVHVDADQVSRLTKWAVRVYICWSVCVDITAAGFLIWYLIS